MAISWIIERLRVWPLHYTTCAGFESPTGFPVLVLTAVFAMVPPVVRLAHPRPETDGRPRRTPQPAASGAARCARSSPFAATSWATCPAAGPSSSPSNHLSYLDILVLGSLYPSLFLAKREIASWPLFGWVAQGRGNALHRPRAGEGRRARRAGRCRSASSLGLAADDLSGGPQLARRRDPPFQPSLLEPAARAGVPCFAASISYETPGGQARRPRARSAGTTARASSPTSPADRVGARRRSRCASRTPRPLRATGSRWRARCGRRPTRRSVPCDRVTPSSAVRRTVPDRISVGSLDPAVTTWRTAIPTVA